MAVLVPLNSFGVLERYKDAGIEEVYMGFHDDAWTDRFGPRADLNRMSGFGLSANPFTFGQMCNQLARAHDLGLHGFVCFNSALYSDDMLDYIKREYLPGIAQAGAQGVIVSGQGLIEPIRETGVDAVISTLAGTFNERLVPHYAKRGASRVILPRDLSLAEIQGIVNANPDLEYEVFLMRNGCTFSDSHCLGQHCEGKPSLCLSLRNAGTVTWPIDDDPETDQLARDAADTEYLWAHYFHRRTCGLCTLWNFEKLGIAAYKVVGRSDDLDDLIFDASLVGRNARLARECATEEEYLKRMERPSMPRTLCGYDGLSCYYPDNRYWETWKESRR